MEHSEFRRQMESGIPLNASGPMHAMAVGMRLNDGGPPDLIDPGEWPQEIAASAAEEAEWWKGRLVSIQLMVELPFWLMIPDCDVSVPHARTSVVAAVRGQYMEVSDGPLFLNSHANVVHIGPGENLKPGKEPPPCVAETQAPVYRPMKTVVLFRPEAMEDSVVALHEREPVASHDRPRVRRINRAAHYLQSLAYAHIPFLNRLITSYRSTSLDPFAFQVSEWDVPVWFAQYNDMLVRIGLMPYWDSDWYPTLGTFGGGERAAFVASSSGDVQTQATSDVPPGNLELLDALSLFYRGRFDDAVRSAVTAIEVGLESQLRKAWKAKGYTDDNVQRRLAETRDSFDKRLAEYEKVTEKRVPGPILSWVPYINGVRLKSELRHVRELRHRIVHEGVRVDIHSRGPMLRAIETMTWLFRWLSWEDGKARDNSRNYIFYSAVRGQPRYPIEYSESGVAVLPDTHDDENIKTADQLFAAQYLASIGVENRDIDLFASMSFKYLGIDAVDAPPTLPDDPLLRERYHIKHNEQHAIAFCLEFDGLIDSGAIGAVALRSLAHERSHGSGGTALCMVHHQRHLPTELREVDKAIPDEVNRIARECGLTLVTTPDLFVLVRGTIENRWDIAEVRSLLFIPGRQGQVPPAYHRIGTYGRFYDRHSVMSVDLDAGETVNVGNTLGVRLPTRYHEEKIESLQVEYKTLLAATGPCKVGIKTTLQKRDLDIGQPVFIRAAVEDAPGATL